VSSQNPSAAASGHLGGTGGRPLSVEDVVVLNDEIRAMVRAGIPLDLGLRGTGGRSQGALREVCDSLGRHLEMGASLDESLQAEQHRLPPAYRAVIAAGLRTGRIDEVLASLSALAESTVSLRRQVRLSLIYPTIILILAYGLFVTFVMYLVPQLQRTYEIFELRDSIWVSVLLWLHRTVIVWGIAVPAVALGLLMLWWIVRRLLPGPGEDLLPGRWIPGGRDLALARFSQMLALLVEHEVPLPEGCRLAGEASGDALLQEESHRVAAAIETGRPLSEAIGAARQIPAFLRWLIVVGDRQGTLAASLRQGAAVHQQRALTKLDWFQRVVPPVIVLGCCGSIVLLYALTLFLPLTEMLRTMGIQ
jgi:type II secretory pathway component PulF